jgi:chemotaxis protein histidine kinase CheA
MNTKKHPQSRSYLIALVVLLFMVVAFLPISRTVWVVSAQETAPPAPSPTPDEELEREQRATKLSTEKATQADNAKKIAEAEKGELEARFPKPSTSPLAGTTTVEGAVIESQIISYLALKKVANNIIDSVCQAANCQQRSFTNAAHSESVRSCPPRLAIYNERDVNLILSYMVARDQIKILDTEYARMMKTRPSRQIPVPTPAPCESQKQAFQPPPPESTTNSLASSKAKTPQATTASTPLGALSIASSFLGAFVDMTALLRTNVEIKGQTFVIDEAPLAAEVFRAARERSTIDDLYYPYVFPPNVNSTDGSALLGQLEATHNLRVAAEKLLENLMQASKELSETNDTIKKLTKSIKTTLPNQTNTALLASGNIIKANCRALSGEVDNIKTLPPSLQASAMVNLIERARKTCHRMDHDKVEQLLGLSDALVQLQKDLKQANEDLANARQAQQELADKLSKLVSMLDLGQISDPTDPDEVKEHADIAASRLKAINTQFDNLIVALIGGNNGTANALTNYIRIERLLSVLGDKDYWLQIKVINAGGNNRTKTNLITDIFRGGNRLSHSGGLIAEYHLFSASGKSVASGVVSEYTKYIKADKISSY